MLGKVTILGGGSFCLGAAVVVNKTEVKNPTTLSQQQSDDLSHYKCKPSELPLYTPLHALNKPKNVPEHHSQITRTPGTIESGVSVVRIEVCKAIKALESQKKNLGETIETGKAHTKFIVDYLNEPDNTAPRIGAIAIGGLSGLILALRGGFIRKLLYTGIGAGGVASVCYPKEAGVYAQHGLVEAKKVANIGYNFVMGVKPGDDVNAVTPKFPTNMSEFKDSLSDLVQSAKDAVFSSKK